MFEKEKSIPSTITFFVITRLISTFCTTEFTDVLSVTMFVPIASYFIINIAKNVKVGLPVYLIVSYALVIFLTKPTSLQQFFTYSIYFIVSVVYFVILQLIFEQLNKNVSDKPYWKQLLYSILPTIVIGVAIIGIAKTVLGLWGIKI